MWRLDLDRIRVLDLRRPAVRDELDVQLTELTGPRNAAQSLAAKARELGAEGLVVPSAAHPGRWNVVVFPSAFAKVSVDGSTATRPKPPA